MWGSTFVLPTTYNLPLFLQCEKRGDVLISPPFQSRTRFCPTIPPQGSRLTYLSLLLNIETHHAVPRSPNFTSVSAQARSAIDQTSLHHHKHPHHTHQRKFRLQPPTNRFPNYYQDRRLGNGCQGRFALYYARIAKVFLAQLQLFANHTQHSPNIYLAKPGHECTSARPSLHGALPRAEFR